VKRISLLLITLFLFTTVKGQILISIPRTDKDTAYITDFYKKHLIIRAYESTKFNNYKLIDGHNQLIYKPNDHNNLGLGFNYRFISLNLGFYDPGLDKNTGIYGRTHDFDLQTHLYVHKFIIDVYGAFYHGYYLSNTGAAITNYNDHVMLRPDISTGNITLEFQYVFNDQHFSYNAPFYQNELQKKSAGSFLLGGGIYHTTIKGDSALVPSNIVYQDFFHNSGFNNAKNNGIGFNAGYAYTFVIKKVFFITAYLSGGCGINGATLSNTYSNQSDEKAGLELNLSEKFAGGYNSDKYFIGITYTRLVTTDNTTEQGARQEISTGNFRFTVAKRLRLKKALIPKSELIPGEAIFPAAFAAQIWLMWKGNTVL